LIIIQILSLKLHSRRRKYAEAWCEDIITMRQLWSQNFRDWWRSQSRIRLDL